MSAKKTEPMLIQEYLQEFEVLGYNLNNAS